LLGGVGVDEEVVEGREHAATVRGRGAAVIGGERPSCAAAYLSLPSSPSPPSPSSRPAAATTVNARHTRLGTVLVNAQGRTLYLFKKDTGTASTCYGGCAAAWPPLTAKKAVAGTGVDSAKLGTTKRNDGTIEVT
jgi:hypothetical protein